MHSKNVENLLREVIVTVNHISIEVIMDSSLAVDVIEILRSMFHKSIAFRSNLPTSNDTLTAQTNQLKF